MPTKFIVFAYTSLFTDFGRFGKKDAGALAIVVLVSGLLAMVPTYCSRISCTVRRRPSALSCFALTVQHVFLPLIPDFRYIAWRFAMFA